jgi:hypothetical protein
MKLEFGDLYKFLVSIGIVFIAASLLIPWFLIREPLEILIKTQDILLLTPLEQALVQNRHNLINFAFSAFPWFSCGALLIGLLSLISGIYYWYNKIQKLEDKNKELSTKKFIGEMEKKPTVDIDEKIRNEYFFEMNNEEGAYFPGDRTENISESEKNIKPNIFFSTEKIKESELQFTLLLEELIGNKYAILDDKRLGSIELDTLLIPKNGSEDDVILDIKFISKGYKYGWLRTSCLKAGYASLLYQKETGRKAHSGIIILGLSELIDRGSLLAYKSKVEVELRNIGLEVGIHYLAIDRIEKDINKLFINNFLER